MSNSNGTKYKPVEVASDGFDSENASSDRPRPSSTAPWKLAAAALVIGLGVGFLVGATGGDSAAAFASDGDAAPVPAPTQRCGGPVEGPRPHEKPWDTLSPAMSSCGGDRGVGLPFAGRSAVLGRR